MSFLTLTQAQQHLRGDFDEADLLLKMSAAERISIEYLQCNVYASDAALKSAIAGVPRMLSLAKDSYNDAYADAVTESDIDLSLMEQAQAMSVYMRAVYEATRTRNGIVINELILSAMLLTLGWLSETREDGEAMPLAAQDLLSPFRCYA